MAYFTVKTSDEVGWRRVRLERGMSEEPVSRSRRL